MEQLISIMTDPRNALLKQYSTMFRLHGAELHVTQGALRLIAQDAQRRGVGVWLSCSRPAAPARTPTRAHLMLRVLQARAACAPLSSRCSWAPCLTRPRYARAVESCGVRDRRSCAAASGLGPQRCHRGRGRGAQQEGARLARGCARKLCAGCARAYSLLRTSGSETLKKYLEEVRSAQRACAALACLQLTRAPHSKRRSHSPCPTQLLSGTLTWPTAQRWLLQQQRNWS